MTVLVYEHEAPGHAAPGHPERPERVAAIAEALRTVPGARFVAEWPAATVAQVEAVHTPGMLAATRDLAAAGGGWLDADTFVTRSSWSDALRAAGAVVDAVRRVAGGEASGAFCAVRPPGHHATADRAMGFCLVNNVAVAASLAIAEGLARRVLVVDHDVHHGNGTQDIFAARSDVLYHSFHLWPHYPGTGRAEETGEGDGEGFTANAPLPRGSGDRDVEPVFDEIFLPMGRAFRPDLVLVSAGFDSHVGDRLGGLALSSAFYGRLVASIRELSPNVVCVLEGGYEVGNLAAAARAEVTALNSTLVPSRSRTGRLGRASPGGNGGPVLRELKRVHGARWNLR